MFYKKFKILTVASSAFLLRGARTKRDKFQFHEEKQGFFSWNDETLLLVLFSKPLPGPPLTNVTEKSISFSITQCLRTWT